MLDAFRKLRLWQKFALMVLVMGVPFVIAVNLLIEQGRKNVVMTRNELDGVEYLGAWRQAYQPVAQHRAASAAVLAGEGGFRSIQMSIQQRVDAGFAAVDAVDAKFGERFRTTDILAEAKRMWQDLKARSQSMSLQESASAHAALVAKLADLRRRANDQSELILDPDLDTYYLMDAVALQLPEYAERLSIIRAMGVTAAASGSSTEQQRLQALNLESSVNDFGANVTRGMKTAFEFAKEKNNPLEPKVGGQLSSSLAEGERAIRFANDKFASGKNFNSTAQQFYDATTAAIDSSLALSDQALVQLQERLNTRLIGLNGETMQRVLISLVVLAAAIVVVWRIYKGIALQLASLTELFGQIGIGNFEARAKVHSQDELGEMADSLNNILGGTLNMTIQSTQDRVNLEDSIRKLLDEISDASNGDLRVEAEVTAEATGAIADAFNNMIGELRSIISQVQQTTLTVSSSATEIQATTEHLADGSESQASQISNATAAIGDMAASIQQVSSNAVEAATVASHALNNARQGTESVQKTINGMNGIRQQVQQTSKRIKRLGESSQEIGEIVQLIGDIADRTSILALNASIQAAMAGEAGKGFAVVAEEVERLAERSTEATKRISSLIKSIQTDTNETIAAMEETTREVVEGSELANEAGGKLEQLESVSKQLSDLIQSISLASKQQSRGSESVARAMGEISDVTQQTAAGAKQAAVSIRRLAELADDLRGSLNRFKLPSAV
ncbi:MAG: chemotaxis protein [Bryobacterales bacterium]|nr:chemotaxis protein [Bryobacterales bacterium]